MRLRTEVLGGQEVSLFLHANAAVFARSLPAFCQRSPWLLAAAQHLPGNPFVITVHHGDHLAAFAALTWRRRIDRVGVTVLGADQADYAPVWARDQQGAQALMAGLRDWLKQHRTWSLDLPQLTDPLTLEAAQRVLPGGQVFAGQPIPVIENLADFTFSRSRRKGHGRALRKLDDLYPERWQLLTITGEVGPWADQVVGLRRERDHTLGRRSHLDLRSNRDFYLDILRGALREGKGRLHVLTLDGDLAGYALVLVDGSSHRIIDGRVAAQFHELRAGAITAYEAVLTSQESGADVFDWLRGVTQEKTHTRILQPVTFQVQSHRWLGWVDRGTSRGRRAVRSLLSAVRRS